MATVPLPLDLAIDRYLDSRALSTARQWRAPLGALATTAAAHGVTTAAGLNAEVLAGHAATLHRLPLSSRRRHLTAIRAFSAAATRAGWMATDPARALRLGIPPAQRPHHPLSVAEQLAILAAAERRGSRDAALARLLFDSGARCAEIAAATVADLREGVLTVSGKGDRERAIPLSAATLTALERHHRRRGPRPGDPLIGGHRGGLSPRRIRTLFHTWCSHSGVRPRGPHQARHACARRLLASGAPLPVIQHLLGHARLSTVLHLYLSPDAGQLRTAVDLAALGAGS